MKYSLRKSFRSHRRKEISDDNDQIYPQIDTNTYSNSNSNLVKPVKSKSFLQRQRRSSSSSSPPRQSSDKIKSKVFEPRYDIYSNDDENLDGGDDDPFSSPTNLLKRPFNNITNQIRKSFRNTLSRRRSRLESTNSNKHLILNKNDQNQTPFTMLHPTISTGLTSPMPKSIENTQIKSSMKRKKAPLAPTQMSQSISLPNEIDPDREQLNNNKQDFNRSIRTRFSFLRKKQPKIPEDQNNENSNQKLTFTQRFNSLRRSFHIGNRNSSNKGKLHLLSDE